MKPEFEKSNTDSKKKKQKNISKLNGNTIEKNQDSQAKNLVNIDSNSGSKNSSLFNFIFYQCLLYCDNIYNI
jgi:hypothetical protein